MIHNRRFFYFILCYLVLLIVCIPAGIAGCVALTSGAEPCIWEDCTMLKDLQQDDGARIVGSDGPVCLMQGDVGCLVVPD